MLCYSGIAGLNLTHVPFFFSIYLQLLILQKQMRKNSLHFQNAENIVILGVSDEENGIREM